MAFSNIWGQPRTERVLPALPEKKKRERHVYPTDEVPHLWAHKTQSGARNQHGNLFFSGDTIYSYGYHFPIARHVVSPKGKPGILITDKTWSNTTSGHVWAVHRAITGLCPSFTVHDVYGSPKEQLQFFHRNVEFAREELSEAKLKSQKVKRFKALEADILKANAFYEWCGSSARFKLPKDAADYRVLEAEYDQTLAARRVIADAKRAEEQRQWTENRRAYEIERAKRREEAAAKLPELIEAWKRGENPQLLSYVRGYNDLPVMLRIVGDQLETSLGARVPVEHCLKALPLIRRIWAKGETWTRNGQEIRLGYYFIDQVKPGWLIAGCHTVPQAEVERIAALIEGKS